MISTLVAQLRTAWWRLLGMKVGHETWLPKIYVTWPHQVSLGARCQLEPGIYFKFDGIYEPGPSLLIGDNVFIGAGCEFNFRRKIVIGAHSLIASGCRFIDHDHGSAQREVPMSMQPHAADAPIVLEEDVWLGANVIVLKGARIARGAIIAAGAAKSANDPARHNSGGTRSVVSETYTLAFYESLFQQLPRDSGQEDFRDGRRPRGCQRGTGHR